MNPSVESDFFFENAILKEIKKSDFNFLIGDSRTNSYRPFLNIEFDLTI